MKNSTSPLRRSLAAVALCVAGAAPTLAAGEDAPAPPDQPWSFDGVFGTFNRPQLQRGLKVYTNVCASCHGLRLLSYRNLTEIGLTPAEARGVAGQKKVKVIAGDGEPVERPAELNDRFVSPFANDQAARTANNGALPPDLSVITKARENDADYIYALLTGYAEPPRDWKDEAGAPRKLEPGQYYNTYFPGHVIAMTPPLNEGAVEYGPQGPKATVEQMALDVAAFLAWAAEPSLEQRKRTGIKVMLFLLLFTGIFYLIKKRVWRAVH